MDYNDDGSHRRLENETTGIKQSHQIDRENVAHHLVGDFSDALLEDNTSSQWRPLNGLGLQDDCNFQEHYSQQLKDYADHGVTNTMFHSNMSSAEHDKTQTGQIGQLKDIINSNRQNVEVSNMNALVGNSYEASNKFGRMPNLPMLPEDLRISKIIRRLIIESNRKAALDLCCKLETAVRNQSNISYICRSFDILFDNMLSVLRQCPVECLEKASSILGIMGYINRYDFPVYKGQLIKAYENFKSIRKYLMMALRTTLRCDAVNQDLKTYSERLLALLKEYLENAEISENFISISETIAEFSKNYKISFQRHFTDIVDIIIGWHLEVDQPAELKRHCSKILQQLAEYFLNELDFTFGLLGQFIEDIETCREDLLSQENSAVTKQQTEIRVGSFIGAFTSIVKALAFKGINLVEFSAAATTLANAKEAFNKLTMVCFDTSPTLSEETVVNLNEFYCIILLHDRSVENLNAFESIIKLQLKHFSTFNDNQQSSFFYMVLNLVRQYRTQLPLSFITLLMGSDYQALHDVKLSCGSKPHKLLMKIYHEILIIKNVPLLQEAYRHILIDINNALVTLNATEAASNSMMRCEMLFNFYLASLTALACQTSSIIGMYALKPSILELLIKNCQGSNCTLWSKNPTLHRALLELIIDHCKKNHNFRQSSRLLQQHQDSPSSENFALILKFLAELLKWHVSDVIFKWLENILLECSEDFEILTQKDDFLSICENISFAAVKQAQACSSIIESLLRYPKIPEYILSNIRDVALCCIESSDKNLAATYCKILAQLPLEVCLSPNYDKQFYVKNKQKISTLFHWHKSSASYNGLRPKYFKLFLESLDTNFNANSKLYISFVEKSSCNIQREHISEYLKTLADNQQLLSYHLQYEAARYCVQTKLRTTAGKPQETFLAIEGVIMKYARFLAEKEGLPLSYKNMHNIMEIQENCRMLLGFLEFLEKHIYNASEGTAYAMLPAENPAKTFFRVNASTCKEWFKRIRTAVNLISIHCMEPELVIRYSEAILEVEANHTNLGLLDRTVTSFVWALYNCGESDTLYGVTTWLKAKHGKRFEWIQHVAEQANGHLEKAIVGYFNTLTDENIKSMDSFMKEFLQKQLIDCLYHTARWSEISSVAQDTTYSKNHLKIMENVYQSLGYHKYDWQNQELTMALLDLTEWPVDAAGDEKKRLTPKLETYSYYEVLKKLQDSCITKANTGYFKNGVFESVRNSVQQGIREGLLRSYEPGFNNNQLNELVMINHVSQKLQDDEDIKTSAKDACLDIKMSSLLLTKYLYWTMICGQHNTSQQCNILLNLISKTRSENNLNYCQSLLSQFFKLKHINLPLNEIVQGMKNNHLNVDYNDIVLVRGLDELVKCLYAQTNSISEALELSSACCSQIIESHQHTQTNENSTPYPASISNLLLTTADWLTLHRPNNTNLTNGQQFQKLLSQFPEIACCSPSDNAKSNALPSYEHFIGKLLNASILCKQNSGEAWFAYGNWCYRWGKKLMEAKGTDQLSSMPINGIREFKLTKRNVCAIQEILKDKFGPDDIEKIIDVLNNHILIAINDENGEELDTNSNSKNTTEILERDLKSVCCLDVEQLNTIFSIWRQAQKGVYSFYEEATRAYFKYLAIESEEVSKRTDVSNSDNNEVEDCTFVTTTLRLLRLIVKHAIGLQDVLEEGLRNTPLRPWKVIVPQLFSRLNHHEPYVRQSLAELLCRLAVNQPQLIIFPAVVGAQQELKHRNNVDTQAQLSNCFETLLNSLSAQRPETVLQVQLLVKELRRITLLWDEYWVHSLSQLYAEYSSLYNTLDAEYKKCNDSELMSAKYEVFRQHLLVDFKEICAVTEKEPETNYERSFQERFGSYIEAVLKALHKTNAEAKPSEYWQKIKQLYNIFQQRPLRGNSSTLRISEISPVLANMQNTTIAMPGVDTYEQPAVYIKSVDATAFIFTSTKTKPKKVSFFGSNGQRYTYLFKGQEDLHLDERIMQFLAISNSMMARSYGSKAKTDCFKANHYSVIPLGSRSGLIRWVDNCFPLFAIYKKWQQRDALLKQQQKERQSISKGNEQIQQSPVATNTTRPSELFYNKLTPLLAECNLKVTDPRRQWPMSVLKRVLKELSAETPKYLLSKEIWCYSVNAVEWRKSVRRYSISLAVMSIIGYVIGLGDRHLDNVLIKLATGEILHIDYSVCFEKGKTLRVPEKVPFRMTQNFKEALGSVGTEGAFRLACTHVLKILRKERETLLTLLEAFVYDPLVDWTVSDDGTTTVSRRTSAHSAANIISSLDIKTTQHMSPKSLHKNRKQETDLSKQAMTLRISEIKSTWIKYKNDFDLLLHDVDLHLRNILDTRKSIMQLEQERDSFSKQQAMIRELEALGTAQASHAFIQRYNTYKHDLENFNKVKTMVQKTLNELDLLLLTHFNIVSNPETVHDIEVNPKIDDIVDPNESEFDVIKDWLIENNWNNAYVQARFNRHDMENTFIQTQRSALECRDLIVFYCRVMQFYPRSQIQRYPIMKYKKTLSNLIEMNENICDDNEVKSKQNIEYCRQYFENMKIIYLDLQQNIVQAKQILIEHKQQPIVNSSIALSSIKDFVSLNPSYNSQLLLICMLRHVLQASQVFQLHEQTLTQNRDYFLPKKQLSFLQLVKTFIDAIYNTCNDPAPNNEILHFLMTALEYTCQIKEIMESLICKLFSVFMIDDNAELQSVLHTFEADFDANVLEKHTKFKEFLGTIDAVVGKLEIALKMLQEKISYMEKIQGSELNDDMEVAFSKINVSNIMQKLCTDLKVTLVESLKQSIDSFQTHDVNNIIDIRKIRYAIDEVLFNTQSTIFEGLLPFVINEINKLVSNAFKPLEIIKEPDLSHADMLCGNLYIALQHESLILCDDFVIIYNSKMLEDYQLIITAYYWLNEPSLNEMQDSHNAFITTKHEFVTRLHEVYQVLVVWKSTMVKIQADLELHRNSFKDLLQSLASTENLAAKQKQFQDNIDLINHRYKFFLNLCISLSEYAAVVLQFEMCSEEQSFENLVKLFAEVRQQCLKSESSITEMERNLVQLLDPEDKIDKYWIENVSGLLDEMIFSTQKKISDMEKDDQSMQNVLLTDGQEIQSLLESTLRQGLRQLLKILTKLCKQPTKSHSEELCQDLKDIQQSLKLLQIKLNELQSRLFSREFDSASINEMQEKIKELHQLCQTNNDDLNALLERFRQIDTDEEHQICELPGKLSSQNDLANKEVINSQVVEQKRNAYAVSVWKRIRVKLEGRDPDHNRRSSVAEQVDFVIREATNEENLASLYEGWTPWV